jgi:hypothetical protein
MTAKKYTMKYYKCHSGCCYVTSNKTCFKKHLNSITHMINNRLKHKNACKRCIDGDPYDGTHLNYHDMVMQESSVDEFNKQLMNDRLVDFHLSEDMVESACDINIKDVSWYLAF